MPLQVLHYPLSTSHTTKYTHVIHVCMRYAWIFVHIYVCTLILELLFLVFPVGISYYELYRNTNIDDARQFLFDLYHVMNKSIPKKKCILCLLCT